MNSVPGSSTPPPAPEIVPEQHPADTRMGRRLALSTISNYAGQLVNFGVWFVLTPFIVHRLGPVQYGLWVLVATFIAYGSLLDFGVGSAVVKYVAELRERGESDRASELIATSLWLYCGLGLLVAVIGVALAPLAPSLINVPPGERHTASWLLALTAFGVAVELPATASFSVLRGLHRFDLINAIASMAILAIAAGTVVVLLLGGGVLAMAAIIIPLTLVWQVPAIIAIRRTAPDLRFGFRGARREHVRPVVSFSSALFGINVATVLKGKTDELVIGAALPVAAVAPYSIARRLADLPGMLAYQFVRVLMPLSSELDAKGAVGLLRELYVSSLRLSLGMFAIVGVPLLIFAHQFITAWVGARYASDSAVVVILICAGLAEVLLWPGLQLLQGMNRHRPLVAFALGSAALNLLLSIILVHTIGVRGVAWGTLIATTVEALLVVPFAMRVTGVGVRELVRGALLPALIPALPMLVVLVGSRQLLDPRSLVGIALTGAVGAVVYIAGYLQLRPAVRERELALSAAAVLRGIPERRRQRR